MAHRLELVATRDGVSYVNDSKATNVSSTLVALEVYEARGPPDRGRALQAAGLHPARALVASRCRAVYLIGEGAGELAAALGGTGVPLHLVGDLERACRGPRAPLLRRARSCCSRPRARAMTPTATSRPAATTSRPWWRRCAWRRDDAGAALRQRLRPSPRRAAPVANGPRPPPAPEPTAPPIEHRLLMTATLCLLAFGAVMVYSASSPPGVLSGTGSRHGHVHPLRAVRRIGPRGDAIPLPARPGATR